jgi:predicted phosphoribosyltransferase
MASGGVLVLNNSVIEARKISQSMINLVARQELRELERQERTYRGEASQRDFSGRVIIVVDDGLATGSTMRAAVAALRQLQPARIAVAVPVGAAGSCAGLRRKADEFVCLHTPEPFSSVGFWYETFEQISDDDVRYLLKTAASVGTGIS